MKQIPNLFTLLNLVFGCLAIVFILQNGEQIVLLGSDGATNVNLPEKMTWASFCIFAAAAIDFLDGFVARLFKVSSEMGKQLDSLADVVSFGVAPGMILYQLLRIGFAQQVDGLDISIAWLLPAFLIPVAGAWRLARFNIDTEQSYSFKGLPIPSAGLFIAALPLVIWFPATLIDIHTYLINTWVLYAIIVVLSWLMVSTLPLMSMKFKDYSVGNNLSKYILVIMAIVAFVILKWLAIPVIIILYIVLSLVFKNKVA
ncbi:MAG: CDP-alcohol phosphatidyltransferase family protein [Bacteroidetes bacterium]|nr:CDP-alcohol phosphatidyltransferase family protein [Bacteroidota bacterium]